MTKKARVCALVFGAAVVAVLGGVAAAPARAAGAATGLAAVGPGDYQVTMTWVSGSHRFATINSVFYPLGGTLPDGARLTQVSKGYITLVKGGQRLQIKIVDKVPDHTAGTGGARALTPLSYADSAVVELDRAIAAYSGRSGVQTQLKQLRRLRKRLAAAADRLAGNNMSPAQRKRLHKEVSKDWLQAQTQLDALRRRIVDSGTGLGLDELRSTQAVLGGATLESLRLPLARLQGQPELQVPAGNKPADLMQSVTALLGSYPDYRALAGRLEQIQQNQK